MSQMTPEVAELLQQAPSLSIEEQEALADSLISNLGGKVDAGHLPLRQPGLLGLMDFCNRLAQRGDYAGKLLFDHLFDFVHRRLAPFGLRTGVASMNEHFPFEATNRPLPRR